MPSVAQIDGLNIPGGAPAVSAPAAAYSVRLLDSAVGVSSYTGAAMRVRRETAGGTGDDDEADIAFDSGVISLDSAISNASAGVTATTLGQFLNVGTVNGTTYTNPDSLTVTASCFTDTWYDQSGNANHAEQTAQANQPQIHSGTVNTDLITSNGKPTLDFDGSNDFMTSAAITSTGDQTFAFVTKADTTSQTGILASSDQRALFIGGGNAIYQSSQSTENDKNYGSYTTSQMLHFVYHDNTTTSDSFGRINTTQNALDPSINGKWDDVILGRYDATSSLNYNGNIQEFIFWTGDQSGNVTGIESNVNTYFSIY